MFIEELKNELDIKLDLQYKISTFANKFIEVCGYKKLLTYNENNVCLSVKNGRINIIGNNLKIAKINSTEILVKGEIVAVNFDD